MAIGSFVFLVCATVWCICCPVRGDEPSEFDSKHRILEIEKVLNSQSREILQLTKTVREQEREIVNLKQKVGELTYNVGDNTRTLMNLDKLLRRTKQKEPLETVRDDMTHADNGQNKNVSLTDANMSTRSSIRKERLLINTNGQMTQKIGFYAYIDHNEIMGQHKVMAFNVAKTNIGQGYSTHSGVFTAPISGLYAFSCSLYPSHLSRGSFHIFANDDAVATMFTDIDSGNWDISASSTTVVLSLNQGDEVYVRSDDTYQNVKTIEGSQYAKSSFSGWLIST